MSFTMRKLYKLKSMFELC